MCVELVLGFEGKESCFLFFFLSGHLCSSIDAVREIRKYDDVTEKVNLQNNPGAMEHFHMKLFRAQRNLYIAGFSLLLSL